VEEFIISQVYQCIASLPALPILQTIVLTAPNSISDTQLAIQPLTVGIQSNTYQIFTWEDSLGKEYAKMVLITLAADVGDTVIYTESLDVIIPTTAICIHSRYVTVADWSELDVPIDKLVVINTTNIYEASRGGGELSQTRGITIDILTLFTTHSFSTIQLIKLRDMVTKKLSNTFVYPNALQWRLVSLKAIGDSYKRVDNEVPLKMVETAYPTHMGCQIALECDDYIQ